MKRGYFLHGNDFTVRIILASGVQKKKKKKDATVIKWSTLNEKRKKKNRNIVENNRSIIEVVYRKAKFGSKFVASSRNLKYELKDAFESRL